MGTHVRNATRHITKAGKHLAKIGFREAKKQGIQEAKDRGYEYKGTKQVKRDLMAHAEKKVASMAKSGVKSLVNYALK